MRVYFLNHGAPLDHLGGSELSLLRLIEAWRRREPSLAPIVVTPSRKGPFMAELRRLRIPNVVVPFEGWTLFAHPGGRPEAALRIQRDFRATRRLIEHMRADSPDLVVTNTVVAPWAAYAAAALGIPHVWFVREFPFSDQGFRFTGGRAESLEDIGLLSLLVVANSRAVRDELTAFVPAEKLIVAPPVMDLEEIRNLAEEPLALPVPPPDADLHVVVVGRITRNKGQWRVIEAIGVLRRRGVRVSVRFVGASVERAADILLRRRARQLGIDDLVAFVGEQENPLPFVREADVAVTPSDREAFGRGTLEYMALGKPVIATATGGTIEVIRDGETGFLVDPESVESLAHRIEQYVHDPNLRAAHGAAGRERAEDIAGERHVDDLIAQLTTVAATETSRLPNTITAWLALPDIFSPHASWAMRALVRTRHFGRRVRAIAKDPVASLSRGWARWRGAGSG